MPPTKGRVLVKVAANAGVETTILSNRLLFLLSVPRLLRLHHYLSFHLPFHPLILRSVKMKNRGVSKPTREKMLIVSGWGTMYTSVYSLKVLSMSKRLCISLVACVVEVRISLLRQVQCRPQNHHQSHLLYHPRAALLLTTQVLSQVTPHLNFHPLYHQDHQVCP